MSFRVPFDTVSLNVLDRVLSDNESQYGCDISLYFIIGMVSVLAAIAMALIPLTWFFRIGEESTRSFEEFNRTGNSDWISEGISLLTTKFGFGWWFRAARGACVS